MGKFTLPYFGELSTESINEYYDVDIDINGNQVKIDLNFENDTIEIATLEKVKKFLVNIESFEKKVKKYILDDYNDEDGDTVKFYIEHHLEEIEKNELSILIDFENTEVGSEQQLLTKLKLINVGLFPEGEDNFAIFDYSIGTDLTNYLIVINIDENGELEYMTMES